MNDSTPIPEGALLLQGVALMEDGRYVGWLASADERALLSPRPDGVPDDAVAEAVRLLEAATPGPWSWSKRSDRLSGGPDGYDDVMTAREYRDGPEVEVSDEDAELIAAAPTIIANLLALLGVPVPPYQPTPPEPEPAETLAECMKAITEAERRAWNQSACGPIAAPVSEVRTGPLGLSEGDEWRTAMTRDEWRVHRDRWLPFLTGCAVGARMSAGGRSIWDKLNDDCPGGFWQSGGNTVSALTLLMLPDATSFTPWDAEDAAPAETLADAITVERDDLAAVLSDIDEWMQYVTPDAEMKDSVRRLRAAAGLSVPSEGGEQ